jgi:hypothetical protein
VLAPFVGAAATAAGLAAAVEVFGLNKSPRLNFGEAEGEGFAAAAAPALVRFALVEAGADAAGLAAAAAVACLRLRFALGEAAGDAAVEGDAAVSAAGAVVSAFLCARFLVGAAAGDSLGLGDWSCAIQTPANAITESRAKIFVVIAARLRKSEH